MNWEKTNRVIEDLIFILIIIIFPMFLLDFIGISQLIEMKIKVVEK